MDTLCVPAVTSIQVSTRYGQQAHILVMDSRGVIAFELHDHRLVQSLVAGRETMESCRQNLEQFGIREGYLVQIGDQFHATG